jgi:hypothetical protein
LKFKAVCYNIRKSPKNNAKGLAKPLSFMILYPLSTRIRVKRAAMCSNVCSSQMFIEVEG